MVPTRTRPLPARVLPALLLLAAAACSDGSPLTPPPPLAPSDPAVAELTCRADVRAGTVRCDAPALAAGVRGDEIVGGQNGNVRLTSTNVSYDSVTQVFGADVTVQNLLVMRMGTDDGTTVTGIRVFFHRMPAATVGTGTVTVRNAHGVGTFTGTGQAYFQYDEILPLNAVSQPFRWEWNVPKQVKNFAFSVSVSTRLLPVVVFDQVVSGNRDLYRVALDGSDLVRLTTAAGDDRNPTVAAGKVVFVSYRHGNGELYSVPLLGGAETRLTTTAEDEWTPALSPDGTALAYASDAGSNVVPKLWTANADGTGAARLTVGFGSSVTLEGSPAWNPFDGSIAFVAALDRSADIFRVAPPASPSLLVGGSTGEVEPAWSPDGTMLAFASNREGDTDVYLRETSSGTITQVTERIGSDSYPSWTTDGRLVYVSLVGGEPTLRWIDPFDPTRGALIPTGTGSRPNRPAVVRF